MDANEIKRKLEQAGIPVGEWSQTKGGTRPLPPTLVRQRALLEQLKGLLEHQIENDKLKVAELSETVNRMKHGGGS